MREFIMNKLIYIFYFVVALLIIFFVFNFFNDRYSFYIVNMDISLAPGTNYVPDLISNNIEYADYSNYDWISQDENIVTVDSLGNIKAISSGKTRIKVKSKKGFHVKYIDINVLTEEIKSLTFKSYKINLSRGDVYKLEPYINGKKNVVIDLTYTVSDDSIISVDKNGIVNALSSGTAKIYVSTSNGVTSELDVNVLEKNIEIESIKFESEKIFVEKGNSMTLTINMQPTDATVKTLTWKSSNPNVASVNNGVVTALSEGTTKITVTTSNGKSAECIVTVKKVEVTSIKLNKSTLTLSIGGSETLVANIEPLNTTNKTLTWKSSNPNVASVNNGVVTALSEGTTKITVTTSNGKSAECSVTVKANTFTNPLAKGQDPWVIKYGNTYYYSYNCGTGGKSICISSFEKLSALNRHGSVVYTNNGSNVWAPELHYINGKWYIYYSVSIDGNNTGSRRMYVISSNNPYGPFTFEGMITDSTNQWAIDGTVLQWNGELYFIWSGHANTSNNHQNIYIAHMSNPTTIDSERVLISTPQYSWEKKGGYINEGPEVLIRNGSLYIIYSSSYCYSEYYSLGMLTYNGGDLLNINSWIKTSEPVFKSGNGVLGPGHVSFVKSPDGTEDWIVYHAYSDKEAIANKNRTIRIQKFTWGGWNDLTPIFGEPIASLTPIPRPSGD